MDVAYDHIQEEILASSDSNIGRDSDSSTPAAAASTDTTTSKSFQRASLDLSAEFQETFRAFSANPWGARLGGIWGNVRRQGESYYEEARQEYSAVSEEAIKGLADLKASIVGRTRGLSLSGLTRDHETETKEKDGDTVTPTAGADIEKSALHVGDGEGLISRFRAEATKRLKDIEKAEDAADDALLRFGTNIRNFLRDAVSIAPPDDGDGQSSNKVLFESKDIDGKRVIHTNRLEAQLHAIHSSLESFSKDPISDEWPGWKKDFNVESKTDDISLDLETYPELRKAMETVVPEKVEYADFWCRYYFLRLVIETEEKRRKELLKDAAAHDEEIAWDEGSDSESPSTPQVRANNQGLSSQELAAELSASGSSMSASQTPSGSDMLKPAEPRRSNDQQSQADSDASYDLVSGATSRAPSSPKDREKALDNVRGTSAPTADDSDEEDWE